MKKIKIAFFYQESDQEIFNRVSELTKSFLLYHKNINIIRNGELDKRYDLYVIASNQTKQVLEMRKKIKVKNKDKIIIITACKDIDHIIQCINITKNMYFLYSKNDFLISKIMNVYRNNQIRVKHTK